MNSLRAVIFDLDDTLFPEESYVFSGFRAISTYAAEHLGIPADRSFRELSQLYVEGVRGNTFNRWLAKQNANRNIDPAEWIPRLLAVYREHQPKIECFAGAHELLEKLGQQYRIGLITDGWLEVQQTKITALNIGRHFQSIVISDQWGRDYWKPHERPFLTALAELEVQPRQAIYVADNPNKDFVGARGVGMRSVRVRHPGIYAAEEPRSAEFAPDEEIDNLEQLVPTIERHIAEK